MYSVRNTKPQLVTALDDAWNIIKWFVRKLVDDNIRRQPGTTTFFPERGLLVQFLLKDDRGILNILMWAPNNYIAVFAWVEDDIRARLNIQSRPGMTPLAYHDECWFNDGLNRVINEYQEHIKSIGFIRAYEIINVSEDDQAFLKGLIKTKYAH